MNNRVFLSIGIMLLAIGGGLLPLVNAQPTMGSITPSQATVNVGQSVTFANTSTCDTSTCTFLYAVTDTNSGSNAIASGEAAVTGDNIITFYTANTFSVTETITDSNPVPGTSTASTSVTVNPLLVLSVNANIINDADSGNNNPTYWAIDNFNRAVQIYQTGPDAYSINFSDFGTSYIPAGVTSPGIQNALEQYNGLATMTGEQSWIVDGTFARVSSYSGNGLTTPSSLTANAFIGTYDAGSSPSDLLLLTQNPGQGSTSQFEAFANSYFSSITSEVQPGYTYTYVYTNPSGSTQTWIDTSNALVPPGDIVTLPLSVITSTPSTSSINADQQITLSGQASGGTSPYSYRWLEETPGGSTFNPIADGTSNSFTFNSASMTDGGTYEFELQATDSLFNIGTSTPVPIAVNAMFANPQLRLFVNGNVTNDEDSGYNTPTYWALDNFNRVVRVWQTGLDSYSINFTDHGTSYIPAGVTSPGTQNALEQYNGIAIMNGVDNWALNGTFTGTSSYSGNGLTVPSSLTANVSIGKYDSGADVADLLSNSQVVVGDSTDTFQQYAESFFSGITNDQYNTVGQFYYYSYLYTSPLGNQIWVDAANVPSGISGDIVTNNANTVVSSTGPTLNVVVETPSDTEEQFTIANTNSTISITSSNSVVATVYLANVTSNSTLSYTSTTPSASLTSFSTISILNLSVTSSTATNFTVGVTIAIPCGSNAAPYEFNSTTGGWTRMPITNSTSCSITFNVPADPVIGIFTSTAIPPTPPPSVGTGVGPQPLPVPSPSPTPIITTPTPTVAPTTPTSPPPPQAPSTVVPSPVATPAPTPTPTTPTTTVVAPAPTTPTSSITPTVIALIAGIAIAIAAAGAYYGLGRRAAAQRKK